jgi:hypothetical protein
MIPAPVTLTFGSTGRASLGDLAGDRCSCWRRTDDRAGRGYQKGDTFDFTVTGPEMESVTFFCSTLSTREAGDR